MKNLFKKFRENKKGFTLAELLVVVAIVGILVAISIPVFTSQLTKARQATNLANLRAAKAAAVAEYLTNDETDNITYNYDPAAGTVKKVGKGNGEDAKANSEKPRTLDKEATDDTKVDGSTKYTKFSVKIDGKDKNGAATVTVYGD